MKTKNMEIRKKLDNAIEAENMEEINNVINNIPDCKPKIDVEDFIKNVKQECTEEVKFMKKKLSTKVLIVAAAVVAVTGVSVGASTLLKQFSFFKDGSYVTITSNGDLSEDEADKLAADALNENAEPNESNTVIEEVFDNIQEAENAYNMKVIIPEKMPDLEITDVTGSQYYMGENSSTSNIWVNYGDFDKKAFGLTVIKEDYADEDKITSISYSDAEKDGEEFISDKGIKFNVLKDSDESSGRTAKIMTTNVGKYQYSMVFFGFSDDEISDIVNSADLNEYK